MRFTLVELMIVVAIIGILAAIAIPNFRDMELRAKMAEVPVCLDGIRGAAVSYVSTHDTHAYTNGHTNPIGTPGKSPRPWNTSDLAFSALGYAPDGNVRATYGIWLAGWAYNDNCGAPVCAETWGTSSVCASAISDIDGDGMYNEYSWGLLTPYEDCQTRGAGRIY